MATSAGGPAMAGNVMLISATNDVTTPFIEVGYASTGFLLTMSCLVFLMTPGLGLFYSGLSRAKSSLSLIFICMLSMVIISVQWFLVGFSLAFSETGSIWIGDWHHFGLNNLGSGALKLTAPAVPGIVFAMFQMKFATITPALIFGSVSERFRIFPGMVFIVVWTTLVYDPVVYWTWGAKGWIRNMACMAATAAGETPCKIGGYDFAGGGPVHVSSGFAALAYAIILGRSRNTTPHTAHDISNVMLGTGLLWFGWFAFTGGSALAATPRAAMSSVVTTIAASFGGLTWLACDWIRLKKLSAIGLCSGIIAGLVCITPAAGFVAPWAAVVFGIVGVLVCVGAVRFKEMIGLDDTLDAFCIHGVGGVIGNILTAIFAQKWVALLDGTVINGGWLDGNWVQMAYQLAGTGAVASYSFIVSGIILLIIDRIPGLTLRASQDEEDGGADKTQMGEVLFIAVAPEEKEYEPRIW